jgi:membrane protease YdiL (CAAX protease family)
MSLADLHKPAIKHGWIRALLLLVLYVGFSAGSGYFLPSFETWIAVSFLLAVILVYFFRVYVDKKSFSSVGLGSYELGRNAGIGAFLASLLVSLGTLVIFLLKGIAWIDIVPSWRNLFINAILLMMVAVGEELVFRGYILRNLVKSMNRWLALLVSAAMFTIVHTANPSVPVVALINTFLAGLLMGLTFMHTRSLWLPVGFHFMWNFLQGPVLGYRVSGIEFESLLLMETKGRELINGGEYGFEGSAVASVLLVLSMMFWIIRDTRYPQAKEEYVLK